MTDITHPAATTSHMALPKFLTEAEAAALLGVARKTLAQWRWRGLPPKYRRFNGSIRYALADLLDFAGEDCA